MNVAGRERERMASDCKSEVVKGVRTALEAGMQVEHPPTLSRVEIQNPTTSVIFRVPWNFRILDAATFTPQCVSIGPYHYNSNGDHSIKLQYLRELILRINGPNISECLDKYIEIVYRRLEDVKKQYIDEIQPPDSHLVWMLVADGCFIIEFLIKWYLNDRAIKTEAMKQMLPVLRTDLLLVENQIPFFILEELFAAFDIPVLVKDGIGLMELALFYLSGGDRMRAQMAVEYYKTSKYAQVTVHHLLHLYHLMCLEPDFVEHVNTLTTRMHIDKLMSSSSLLLFLLLVRSLTWIWLRPILKALFWLLSKIWWSMKRAMESVFRLLHFLALKSGLIGDIRQSGSRTQDLWGGIPNASYLRDTGFKFKKKEPLSSFSYVTRKGRTIEIPEVSMDFTPLVLLRNLIMFELCPLNHSDSVAGFAKLMEYLIVTAEDVAILKDCGIIDKRFGNNDEMVARIFNTCLSKDICLNDDHYLNKMFADVRDYYDQNYYQVKFYQWRKKLIPDYFSNPWAVPSMTAAFIILALTVVSTFYTVYPYYHPRS